MTRPVSRGRALADAAALAALVVVAVAPLLPAYASADFWIAAVGGALLGAVVGYAGWRFRFGMLTVAAVAVAAYFVFGGALAVRSTTLWGVVPTLDTLQELAVGVVVSWKRLLTVTTPAVGFDSLLIVPLIVTLVAASVSVSIALRTRRAGWAVLPLGAAFVFSVVFSTFEAFAPAVLGAVLAAGSAAWLALRAPGRAENLVTGDGDAAHGGRAARSGRGRRALGAAGMVAVALVAGVALGGAAPAPDRVVLRDSIVPPLELHDYASPLMSFRKYTRDGEESTLFRVTGLPQGALIRLATLDQYDGVVYRVSGDGSAGSGSFTRVGREIENDATGDPAHVSFEIVDLRGVWLPDAGSLSAIAIDGSGHDTGGSDATAAARRGDGLHYNAATGTAVLTGGLAEGDRYTIDTVLPLAPDDDRLEGARVAAITTPTPQNVPDAIAALVSIGADAGSEPLAQLRAIEATLHDDGFFSHGLEGEVASRSGHTAERVATLLDGPQMIGDDEQYAVAMALATAQLGLPVRVVMGFRATDAADDAATTATTDASATTFAVTAADVHAWVEVPFAGIGWVPFDPTPPEDQVPQEEVPEPKEKPQAQVLQPPPPPQAPVDLPPDPPVEEAADGDQPVDFGWLWETLRWTGVGLIVLALVFGPAILLGILRANRRRSRRRAPRSSDRVSGGWNEVVDTAVDLGAPVPAGGTRREQLVVLDERYPGHPLGTLATRADVAVFGAADPDDTDVDAYWADVSVAVRGLEASAGWRSRMRRRFAPRSVLRELRARLTALRSARRSARKGHR